MDLLTFIADGDRKTRLAAATRSSEGYLWQIATGWRGKRPSPELALEIERVSRELADQDLAPGSVAKESLRPDLWPPSELPVDPRPAAAGEGTVAAGSNNDMSEAA
jgi:hypothetical protein